MPSSAIDRNSPLPLWAQLLDDLRLRLSEGEFAARFPTDKELVETYGVSRHTAREAVRRLTEEGIIQRERGRGTTVRTPEFEQPLGALYSMFRSIEAQGAEQRSDVLALEVRTDADAAARLGVDAGTELVYLERIRRADGVPLAVDRIWLPHRVAGAVLDADFTHTALYDELQQRLGIVIDRATERILPVLPDELDRVRLEVAADQPCFAIERLGLCHDHPIEWRHTLIRGDRFAFVASWAAGAGGAASGSNSSSFELAP
ncbi:MAG: GntR family transcriptional regulator [Acidimicrobiia bacterium]